ncbi:Aldehyde dehydrogenase [Mortierella sp. GBA35]|nr:Aldehyde dehydrogenase [Mortierella sp. GBA35]KAG0220189.1 Aldehyde dehydrogenase [Mortierella sp. NVP41]
MTSNLLHFNTDAEINQAAETVRQTFRSGSTRPLKYRRHQLEQLWRLVDENSDLIAEALHKDLRKHKNEMFLGELVPAKEEINDALEHLEEWAKDEKVVPALVNRVGVTCLKRKEPKGAVLIISPWNYPFFLTLGPMAGAIAAGCTAVIKPSEVAPHSAKVMTDLFARYLDNRAYIVINGAAHETTKLLEHKWDHIFYTGNGVVAKIIMRAAAQHLTSLTLELGGKSPAIIDEHANMTIAAKRVAFGKTFNAGQTCVAPDYVLITAKAQDKFIAELKKAFVELYSKNPQSSTDYGRIINNRHFHRLCKVLQENKSGDIVIGGQTDEKDLYIAPTVIANVDRDDKLMEDELFGPLLPMIQVADVDDAIEYINSRDEPLALYIFTNNKKFSNKIMDSTRSGAVLVNDTLMHVAEGNLPFGGTGPSGMGSYHGKKSFDTFSHERSTMIKDLNPISEAVIAVRYAPYTDNNLRLAKLVMESVPRFKKSFVFKHLKWIVIALIFGIAFRRF